MIVASFTNSECMVIVWGFLQLSEVDMNVTVYCKLFSIMDEDILQPHIHTSSQTNCAPTQMHTYTYYYLHTQTQIICTFIHTHIHTLLARSHSRTHAQQFLSQVIISYRMLCHLTCLSTGMGRWSFQEQQAIPCRASAGRQL